MTLVAGCCNPGVIYRHLGNNAWESIFHREQTWVLSLAAHENELYASVATYDKPWEERFWVYKYDSGTDWSVFAGPFPYGVELIVYNEDLYACEGGSSDSPSHRIQIYNLSGSPSLSYNLSGWPGIWSACVHNGWLYVGASDYTWFARWDGATVEVSDWYYARTVFAMGGSLYAGIRGGGAGGLWGLTDGIEWALVTKEDRNIFALEMFQGQLYAGLDSQFAEPRTGQLRRGTNLELVWEYPVGKEHEGILSFAADNDYLYMGTGGELMYYYETGGSGVVYQYDGNTAVAISETLSESVVSLCFFDFAELGEIRGIIIRAGQNVDPTAEFITFQNVAGNDVGKIIGSGSGGISYTTSSDLRLKKVLGEVNEQTALNALRVKPVRFTSIHDDRTELHGFRAQELAGSTKGVVMFDESQDLYTMDYGRLATYLWRGWQMQEREIDALLKAVDKLKKEGEQCA